MSRSLNKVMLIGNVGNDPEVRSTPSGQKIAKLSLATNRSFTDREGQQQEKTEWHRLTFWAKLADLVEQYVKKGDRLYVEGRIEYSQTEDQSGNTRYWTDVIVNEMVMLGSQTGGGGGGYSQEGGYDRGERQGGYDRGERQERGGAQQPQQQRRRAPAPQSQGSPFEDDEDDLPF